MEEAKPAGGVGVDVQPQLGPNGHFVSSVGEKTRSVSFHS